MKKWIKRTVLVVIILGVAVTAIVWYRHSGNGQTVAFKTAKITRGNLLVTIDASGTLEPEEVVDVGAQVGGQILEFGTDINGKTVDYSSEVEQGALLAKIDDALSKADVSEAEASVLSAKATLQKAKANLEQLKAQMAQAQRDWERAQKLGASEALAQTTYDNYKYSYEMAKANVDVGEAVILEAQAALAQAETSLWRANRNLGYCTISSPVSGTIIARRVNIGQTVTASLDTPSLFLIAKDLKRMQIWAAVNEADIAKIYSGQPVAFTVDALPDETFKGEVIKIRLNASMTQNVVTYTVEILADNSSGKLLPYMTANVEFEVAKRDNVLLVPTAALRWTPSVEQVDPEYRSGLPEPKEKPASAPETATETSLEQQGEEQQMAFVYAVHGEYVRPIPVKVGISNGVYTEVESPALSEGLEIVIGTQTVSGASGETSNPFTPKMPSPPKGGSGPPR